MRTYGSRRADDGGRAMGDLADGAILGGLVNPMGVECFRGRKSDKCRESEESRKTEKAFHNSLRLIIYGDPKATSFFPVPW